MKIEFEKKLYELGLSYQGYPDNSYLLRHNIDVSRTIRVKLICSKPVDELKLDSRNGDVIQSIGHFKLRFTTEVKEPDFFILAFRNSINHCVELIIIPAKELKRRLIGHDRISRDNQEVEIVFWLMVDDYNDNWLYDCTNIGIEFEWYYLSKGIQGRMIDHTNRNYTKFLNNWERLKMI